MRMTKDGDANARQEVDVLAALGVVQTRTVAAHERDRHALVGLQHVLRVDALDLARCAHGRFHLITFPKHLSGRCACPPRRRILWCRGRRRWQSN
jgi:hypothetical protein